MHAHVYAYAYICQTMMSIATTSTARPVPNMEMNAHMNLPWRRPYAYAWHGMLYGMAIFSIRTSPSNIIATLTPWADRMHAMLNIQRPCGLQPSVGATFLKKIIARGPRTIEEPSRCARRKPETKNLFGTSKNWTDSAATHMGGLSQLASRSPDLFIKNRQRTHTKLPESSRQAIYIVYINYNIMH